VLVLVGVALYTATSGGTLAVVGAVLAGAGALVMAVGLGVRIPLLVPWAVLLAGGGYLVGREHHTIVDGWAPVVGAGLLLAAELATWSIEHDRRIFEERALVVRRSLTLAGLVGAAAVVGFVLVGAAAISVSSDLLVTAVGVAAAVASIAVVYRLLRA
jgi:hypothetical protein